MKNILKLEEAGLFLLAIVYYYTQLDFSWGWFLGLFFVPDLAFTFVIISKRVATAAYNFMHHRGVMALVIIIGFLINDDMVIMFGIVFMAHSCFDRVLGYGLKYYDNFDHTHLGWTGKSKHKNQ
ncbi:DUF4260 domain-containing protein [Fulvivirga lutimaris]|uniref:DUF4260 domain-containing protein n=1 Tax=Fulvivirga lutimaris TaxID=1819566 RepID=UPI0012BCF637|nr:DUF4260 domain-containing protein [Fulvivirga lutimaris]MTI39532.1 DUF4260 family protein [Fulvivirga lutimaris]